MKNALIVIGLLHTILFIGCSKPADHIHIDPYLVKTFSYKPGTYWILKDSLTGEKDSFLVQKIQGNTQPLNDGTEVESIDMDIYQYNESRIKVARWQLSMDQNVLGLYYDGGSNIYNSYVVTLLITPVDMGLLGLPTASDSEYIVSVNGSYTINSRNYTGVVISRHVCDTGSFYPHFDDTYYINDAFGFIKMDINRGTHKIWELERSRIIR